MAVANYHDHFGCLPPAYIADENGRPMHSWRVLILPWLEQKSLYDQYRFDEPWDGPHNRLLADKMPAVFAFHDKTDHGGITNYLRVVGPGTASPGATTISNKDITDGTDNTLLIVENLGAGVNWLEPRDLEFDVMSFAINDPRGISSWYANPAGVTVQGMTHKLPIDANPEAVRALFTIAAGESGVDHHKTWQPLPDGRVRKKVQ